METIIHSIVAEDTFWFYFRIFSWIWAIGLLALTLGILKFKVKQGVFELYLGYAFVGGILTVISGLLTSLKMMG